MPLLQQVESTEKVCFVHSKCFFFFTTYAGAYGSFVSILTIHCAPTYNCLRFIDGNKWHKHRSNPELSILFLNFAHCSNHLTLPVFKNLEQLPVWAALDNDPLKPPSNLHQVLVLGFDRKLENELPQPGEQTHHMGEDCVATMDAHPELTLLVCSHVIWESREVGENLWCSSLFAFQPVFT